MSLALLDTSVVIAAGDGGDELPPSAAISVVTLGELRAGVLRAANDVAKTVREQRLAGFRAAFIALPIDEDVAEHYGRALALARDEGRIQHAPDLLIVATAMASRRTLHTRDIGQAKLARRLGLVVHGPA